MVSKISRSFSYVIISAFGLIFNPVSALAIDDGDLKNINLPVITTNKKGTEVLTGVAATVINLILLIAGILAVIYLIYSGILYITAGGDTGKAEKGRTGIVNAIIGLVIISAAYLLVRFVGGAISGANNLGSSNATI